MLIRTIFAIIISTILVLPAYAQDCPKHKGDGACGKTDKKCGEAKDCPGQSEKSNCPNAGNQSDCQGPCDPSQCPGSNMGTEGCSMDMMMKMMPMMEVSPLDPPAKEFIQTKVKKIAILPFSDYSITSTIKSKAFETWAARRIHDQMTNEFNKMGKLVTPYDSMVIAVSEVLGKTPEEISGKSMLKRQLTDMDVSQAAQSYVTQSFAGPIGESAESNLEIQGLDLTSGEVIALGKALKVDCIFMGAISDYGVEKYRKNDALTYIPPFIGLWKPREKAEVRMMVYLYDTSTGEMIWSSMEEATYEPGFKLFKDGTQNIEKLNYNLAVKIVNHFRDVPMMNCMMMMERPSQFGGPGTTRRIKDVRVIIRQK